MQVGAINSVNFKANEKFDLYNNNKFDIADIEKSINAVRILENRQNKDTVEFSDENQNQEPEKKNILELALSLAGTVIGAFLLSRKAYNKVTPKIQGIFENISKKVDLEKYVSNAKTKINNIGFLKNAVEAIKGMAQNIASKDNFVVNKLRDKANVAGVIGAIAGTTYIATTDGNGDGIADIAQKGVNVYNNAVRKFGPVAEAIRVLS